MDANPQPTLTHQMGFVYEALASLFHNSPEEYFKLLSRDGTKFLRFYWDEAGKNAEGARRMDSFGLNYEFRSPERFTTVLLVSLPRPLVDGEAYFTAQVYRPLRRTPFLGVSDITRMYSLELAKTQPDGTRLREHTRRFRTVDHGPGPAAVLDDFYNTVLKLMEN
jgi:hypothetical protein